MDLEEQIRSRRREQAAQIAQSLGVDLIKGKAADEGEEREWGGKKYKKTSGKWIPVTDGKDKKKDDDPKNSSKKSEDPKSDGKAKPSAGEGVDKHEIAQLTALKATMESNPEKAYEIFQSLSPEAQQAVPQDVVNKLVEGSHSEGEDEAAKVFEDDDQESFDQAAYDKAIESKDTNAVIEQAVKLKDEELQEKIDIHYQMASAGATGGHTKLVNILGKIKEARLEGLNNVNDSYSKEQIHSEIDSQLENFFEDTSNIDVEGLKEEVEKRFQEEDKKEKATSDRDMQDVVSAILTDMVDEQSEDVKKKQENSLSQWNDELDPDDAFFDIKNQVREDYGIDELDEEGEEENEDDIMREANDIFRVRFGFDNYQDAISAMESKMESKSESSNKTYDGIREWVGDYNDAQVENVIEGFNESGFTQKNLEIAQGRSSEEHMNRVGERAESLAKKIVANQKNPMDQDEVAEIVEGMIESKFKITDWDNQKNIKKSLDILLQS